MRKKRIATVSLAGCFGCHMSLLDMDERLLDLLQEVEFDRSPLNDLKRFTGRCDLGLVEGGCCNEENVHTLQEFRRNCEVLVAVGQCRRRCRQLNRWTAQQAGVRRQSIQQRMTPVEASQQEGLFGTGHGYT